MRIFIAFDGLYEPFDVSPNQNVGTMKKIFKDIFLIQLIDDKQVRHFLELRYAGATLEDNWALSDLGITTGCAIQCMIKTEHKPVLLVFNAVTGETISIMGTVFLLDASVDRLKSLVSLQCGLPVSAFGLSMLSGVPLFDCNQLHDYAIEVGVTLRLDTWDGWMPFLHGCFLGHSLTVQRHLSKERAVMRFQLRVALFVAAYLGHLDLAGWLLKRGLRAEEPVGVHPYRQWCYQTAHPEAVKCPVHTAAEQGHLLILKLFISSCVLNLTCPDPKGRYPLKIAIQYGHRDCVCYLSTKLCSVVSLPYLALPMNIYLQIKRWIRLGEDRAASNRCQWHRPPLRARVGDTVLVDGYTQPKVLCQPEISEKKAFGDVKHGIWQPFTVTNTPIIVHNLQSKQAKLETQLPKLHSDASDASSASKDRKKKRRHEVKCIQDGQSDKIRNVNSSLLWRSKVPLPPISCESNPRPLFISSSPTTSHILTASLESFSHYCGRTPRENAIYCLAMARKALAAAAERSSDPGQEECSEARNLRSVASTDKSA